MILNMGPQHPSTHGVLRLILEIDGENVVRILPDIGYLHTGIEKTCEAKFYQQVVPLTDRIDYLCPLTNNLCYVLAVEKLLGLEIPPKAQWMRVLLNELTRINSHLVWLGTHALDIGAMSVFLYCFREREDILRIFEMFSGQRIAAATAAFQMTRKLPAWKRAEIPFNKIEGYNQNRYGHPWKQNRPPGNLQIRLSRIKHLPPTDHVGIT